MGQWELCWVGMVEWECRLAWPLVQEGSAVDVALGTVTRRKGAAGVMWCRQRQGRGMGIVYLVVRILSGL